MKPLGSLAALVAAIRDDAVAEAEAIGATAAATVARITADAAACPPPPVAADRALATAHERARIRVAQEDWHDASEAMTHREEWIQRVIALGAQQLRERQSAADTKAVMTALAREAVARLPPGSIEIVVTPADAALLDRDWRASVSPSGAAEQVVVTAAPIDGGCIARSVDGRASFDNTYAARTERLQSMWRAALSDFYERITSQIGAGPAAEAS